MLVVAVVIAAAVLFAPSWLTLRSAEPAPQAPPVVVVPAPSPGDDGTSSPAPSVAPSRAAEPGSAVAESVDEPTVLAQVPVGSTPGFAATPPPGARAGAAGQQLYVANRAAGVLTVVDTATHAVRGTIPIDDGPPQYVAFSPDGTRAYVSVFSEQNNEQNNAVNRVVVVDTLRGGVVASIPVGTRPYALAVTPDATGSEVWVPNHDAASVSIIDTATNTVTKTLPVTLLVNSIRLPGRVRGG